MHIGNYLGLADTSEQALAEAFEQIAEHHHHEPDIEQACKLLASWSRQNRQQLQPFVERYAEQKSEEPERLNQSLFEEPRSGSLALLRDLHDLYLLAHEVELCWIVISQAALGLRDKELEETCTHLKSQTKRQISWLLTRIKQAAPQSLLVAD